MGSTTSEVDLAEEERREKVGVPLFSINSSSYDDQVSQNIMAAGLPTVEEVSFIKIVCNFIIASKLYIFIQ